MLFKIVCGNESCGGQHSTMECHSGQMTVKQAQYVNQQNQPQQGQYGGNAYQNRKPKSESE